MPGILTELLISWLLLWFFCHKHLSVLGFKPTTTRLADLGTGLLLGAACCIIYHLMATNSWMINRHATVLTIFKGAWWVLKSVLFEELIFRGALLYIAIKKMGITKACILSAVCFGIYHFFSYNLFGNPVQMLIVFFMTGITGLILAFAFARTGSLYLPVALHFGWNYFNIVVFSSGPLGAQLLIRGNGHKLEGIPSLFVFLFQIFALPLVTYWYLRRYRRAD